MTYCDTLLYTILWSDELISHFLVLSWMIFAIYLPSNLTQVIILVLEQELPVSFDLVIVVAAIVVIP
jgi:hypothetical protein